ncbi:unnamed protein product [Linum tenue]|uniref:HORMA domain-containing protein n=1 Tax=Linum tenue TaxID=586396 RepID=A0AAV0RE30_9ROSI|nr:unnamed protein product [Linum tenue]
MDTRAETARILVEFLEVAITSIVFHKRVYPAGAFERRRYMNAVVHRAKQPELRDYIHSSVNALFPFIQKGLVERVLVIFFNKDDNVVNERFVFKLGMNQSSSSGSKIEEADLEFSLRSFLIKLPTSENLTKPLPPGKIALKSPHLRTIDSQKFADCRWEVTAYFRGLPEVGTSKEADVWIPTDTKQWQHLPEVTPIKSMSSQPLSLQLFVEHPSPSEPKTCHV